MPTIGLFLLLVGTLLLRQVVVGRTLETGGDLKDLATATLSGDAVAMQEVLQRRGTNAAVESVGEGSASTDSTAVISREYTTAQSSKAGTLINTCMVLGNAAKGYRWGATGMDYYDCSGLIWRACTKDGFYKGGRFTTTTFGAIASKFARKVEDYAVGDIVVWPGKHMGVVTSRSTYYSARSVEKGIGSASLKDDTDYFGGTTPEYWRLK